MRLILLLLLPLSCFCQPKYFLNDGHRIWYEEFGKGAPLYILTGGPGAPPRLTAQAMIDSLSSHFTVVLLHQRGTGLSRAVEINENNINVNAYLSDIELLRQKRKDKQIILAGISWGGFLAMAYTAAYPKFVKDLLLLGAAPPSWHLWPVLADNQHVRRSKAEKDSMQLLASVFGKYDDKELDSMKRADPQSAPVLAFKECISIHVRAMHYEPAKAAGYIDSLFYQFNFQPIGIIDREIMEKKWDLTGKLKQLKTPALILYGRQDDQGEATFYHQKEVLRNSRMVVIEKCGHIMWEDQPEEFFRIIRNYLKIE